MKYYTLPAPDDGAPTLGGTAALADASPEELRVLVCLFETHGYPETGLSDLARAAGCSVARARAALTYWQSAGVIALAETADGTGVPDAKKPLRRADGVSEQTGREIAATIDDGHAAFIATCEELLGHVFNTAELNILTGLLTELRLSEEYLLTLISYCRTRVNNERFSLRYLEKTAFSLFDKDILTLDELNAYLAATDRFRAEEWKLRRLLGIGERKLTKKEEEFLRRWTSVFSFTSDVIGIAYDITVDRTGKLSLAYMDKLLSKFHEAGCATPGDVDAFLAKENAARAAAPARRKPEEQTVPSSFNAGDFMAAALKRSFGDDGQDEKKP